MEALSEVGDLDTITHNKRVQWAASVYGRALPILREEAERVLRELLDPDVQLRGLTGLPVEVEVVDFEEKCAVEYSDGNRAVGVRGSLVTAAATRPESLLFGRYATVMDGEEAGVMLAWKGADSVALESQGEGQPAGIRASEVVD